MDTRALAGSVLGRLALATRVLDALPDSVLFSVYAESGSPGVRRLFDICARVVFPGRAVARRLACRWARGQMLVDAAGPYMCVASPGAGPAVRRVSASDALRLMCYEAVVDVLRDRVREAVRAFKLVCRPEPGAQHGSGRRRRKQKATKRRPLHPLAAAIDPMNKNALRFRGFDDVALAQVVRSAVDPPQDATVLEVRINNSVRYYGTDRDEVRKRIPVLRSGRDSRAARIDWQGAARHAWAGEAIQVRWAGPIAFDVYGVACAVRGYVCGDDGWCAEGYFEEDVYLFA